MRKINAAGLEIVKGFEALLREDLAGAEAAVSRALGAAPTSENQFSAFVSLAFNIGAGNFDSSTALRRHLAGDFAGAADAIGMWNKQKGKVLAGLVRRRKAEAELYKTP